MPDAAASCGVLLAPQFVAPIAGIFPRGYADPLIAASACRKNLSARRIANGGAPTKTYADMKGRRLHLLPFARSCLFLRRRT